VTIDPSAPRPPAMPLTLAAIARLEDAVDRFIASLAAPPSETDRPTDTRTGQPDAPITIDRLPTKGELP